MPTSIQVESLIIDSLYIMVIGIMVCLVNLLLHYITGLGLEQEDDDLPSLIVINININIVLENGLPVPAEQGKGDAP